MLEEKPYLLSQGGKVQIDVCLSQDESLTESIAVSSGGHNFDSR